MRLMVRGERAEGEGQSPSRPLKWEGWKTARWEERKKRLEREGEVGMGGGEGSCDGCDRHRSSSEERAKTLSARGGF